MAQGVRRQGPVDHGERRAGRGVRPRRRSPAGRLLRRHPRRAHHPAVGHRGAEEGVPAQDPVGPDQVVPGLQRARHRVRPGVAEDHGRARRRRVGDQRPEGVDHPGPERRLHLPAGPHRSGGHQAQGHLVPAGADAAARRRGARHHPTRRHRRVQRGLLRQRAGARRRTSLVASTTVGSSPIRRWPTSGGCRPRRASAASRRSSTTW